MSPRVVFQRGLLFCVLLAICILASSPQGLFVFVFFAVCAFYVQRKFWKIRSRSRLRRFGFLPTYASFGNAFQQLQMLAEPQTQYVIEEKAVDGAEEEDDGEPEDEADLLHQLKKIRNGDRGGQLVVSRVKSE